MAAALVFAVMAMFTLSVVLRALVGGHVAGDMELSEYAMLLITALTAPWLLRLGRHVRLDVVLVSLQPRLAWVCELLCDAIGCAVSLLMVAERRLARQPAIVEQSSPSVVEPLNALFLAGTVAAALGFQIHFSFNTAGQYLRFAADVRLEWLMPLFWVAFGLAMVPAGQWAARAGVGRMLAAGALVSAAGAWIAGSAGSLEQVIAGQLMAGAGWGVILMSAFTRASEAGRSGREGLSMGLLFAALAGAALSRLAAAVVGLPKDPAWQGLLSTAPVVLWVGGAVLFTLMAVAGMRRHAAVM